MSEGSMSGGRKAHAKGSREERLLVRLLQSHALNAERVPRSGAAGGRFAGDVSVLVLNEDWRIEAKVRGRGFRRLYAWPEERDALVVRADRKEALVVLTLRRALAVLAVAEKAEAAG
jgi:Holliday junction resolvase